MQKRNDNRKNKQVAAALLLMPLFVLSGCSGNSTVYLAGLQTETASEADLSDTSTSSDSDGSLQKITADSDSPSQSAVSDSDGASQNRSDQTVQGIQTEASGYIYVCGAVRQPGVYPIYSGMRVYEAIALAGGFSEEADEQWLNQAEMVQDSQRLYVYTKEETQQMEEAGVTMDSADTASAAVQTQPISDSTNGKININTADKETLMTLPGIGESRADAVIQYRQEHGAFSSIEEIQNISGIKNAVFSKLRDLITV